MNESDRIGRGCEPFLMINQFPNHNPEPSTARGKRRHAARDDGGKKRAEAAWNKDRSKQKSRYQERLGGQHKGQK